MRFRCNLIALHRSSARHPTGIAIKRQTKFIKQRHIDNCIHCDPAYGAGVAKALGMEGKSAAEVFTEIRSRKDNA